MFLFTRGHTKNGFKNIGYHDVFIYPGIYKNSLKIWVATMFLYIQGYKKTIETKY